LTILICICCGNTKEDDEQEIEDQLKLERTKHELLTLREMNQHSISGRLAQAVEHDKAGEYRKISRELRPVEEKLGNEVLTGKKPVADPEQEGTGEGENKPDDPDAA
jgi:hypothetical protein